MSLKFLDRISQHAASGQRIVAFNGKENQLKVMSRTLLLRGWKLLLDSTLFVFSQLHSNYGVELISVDRETQQCFVTFVSRTAAEQFIKWHLAEVDKCGYNSRFFNEKGLRIRWSSNIVGMQSSMSPTDDGIYAVRPEYLTDWHIKLFATEIGGAQLKRHYSQVVNKLKPASINWAKEKGVWLGGVICEEPYFAKKRSQSNRFVLLDLYSLGQSKDFAVASSNVSRHCFQQAKDAPRFVKDTVKSLALGWLKEAKFDQKLSVEVINQIVSAFYKEILGLYDNQVLYEVYQKRLQHWLVSLVSEICVIMEKSTRPLVLASDMNTAIQKSINKPLTFGNNDSINSQKCEKQSGFALQIPKRIYQSSQVPRDGASQVALIGTQAPGQVNSGNLLQRSGPRSNQSGSEQQMSTGMGESLSNQRQQYGGRGNISTRGRGSSSGYNRRGSSYSQRGGSSGYNRWGSSYSQRGRNNHLPNRHHPYQKRT